MCWVWLGKLVIFSEVFCYSNNTFFKPVIVWICCTPFPRSFLDIVCLTFWHHCSFTKVVDYNLLDVLQGNILKSGLDRVNTLNYEYYLLKHDIYLVLAVPLFTSHINVINAETSKISVSPICFFCLVMQLSHLSDSKQFNY